MGATPIEDLIRLFKKGAVIMYGEGRCNKAAGKFSARTLRGGLETKV